jgi:methionyl-tRNA formyltransferase
MKIIFMGTPDFAVGILNELLDQKFDICAVVTAPDKPAGRGQKISESEVKKAAQLHSLPILQPSNLKDDNFINELKTIQADLFVVVAFRMLPEIVWSMPPKGTINLHASLLPNYRGAAPINWAIINGETKTGVTTFFIEQEIDTGLVIEREEVQISENETVGDLHDKLLQIGKKLVTKSVQKISAGNVKRTPQHELIQETKILPAPKIFKNMCKIEWTKNVKEIHDFCRGLSPYPGAWTSFENLENGEIKTVKIIKTEKTNIQVKSKTEFIDTKTELFIPCSDYYIKVLELQIEGKKRMLTKDFLIGHNVNKFKIFSVGN